MIRSIAKTERFLFLIIFTLFFCIQTAYALKKRSMDEALKRGEIEAQITGNPNNPNAHKGQSINVKLKNNTDEELEIKLPKGTTLKSKTPDYQNMIVAKDETFYLPPREELDPPVYAYCIEFTKAPPNPFIEYEVGPVVTGKLKRVIDVIDRRGLYDSDVAQLAIWRVTDDLTQKELEEKLSLGGLRRIQIDEDTAREVQSILDEANTGLSFRKKSNLLWLLVIIPILCVIGVGGFFVIKHIRRPIIRTEVIKPSHLSCPSCNTACNPEDVFCSNCGVQLKQQTMSQKGIYCPNCGTYNQDANFCISCGANLSQK